MKHQTAACFRQLKTTLHISYAMILGILWANEIFDIPYRLNIGPKTPQNYSEAFLESAAIIIVWIATTHMCKKALMKIKVLEGLLPICSECKKIKSDNQWHEIADYISDKSEADFTHSLCPTCLKKLYPDIADSILRKMKEKS